MTHTDAVGGSGGDHFHSRLQTLADNREFLLDALHIDAMANVSLQPGVLVNPRAAVDVVKDRRSLHGQSIRGSV